MIAEYAARGSCYCDVTQYSFSSFIIRPQEYGISLRILTALMLVAFVVAFVIHGQQIEATSRLDFLWKLQATGDICFLIFLLERKGD